MSNIINYKGFKSQIKFSADDNVFFGHLLGIDDVVSFHGETVDELKNAFHEAVDFHIEVCAREGKKPKKHYSGKLLFRLPNELHAKIAEVAAKHGKSINEWGKEVFESAVKS